MPINGGSVTFVGFAISFDELVFKEEARRLLRVPQIIIVAFSSESTSCYNSIGPEWRKAIEDVAKEPFIVSEVWFHLAFDFQVGSLFFEGLLLIIFSKAGDFPALQHTHGIVTGSGHRRCVFCNVSFQKSLKTYSSHCSGEESSRSWDGISQLFADDDDLAFVESILDSDFATFEDPLTDEQRNASYGLKYLSPLLDRDWNTFQFLQKIKLD